MPVSLQVSCNMGCHNHCKHCGGQACFTHRHSSRIGSIIGRARTSRSWQVGEFGFTCPVLAVAHFVEGLPGMWRCEVAQHCLTLKAVHLLFQRTLGSCLKIVASPCGPARITGRESTHSGQWAASNANHAAAYTLWLLPWLECHSTPDGNSAR